MPRRMRISRAGIELIKSFEGFTPRTTRIDDERWVIGYGHVRSDQDQYRVSRDEAEQILKEYDLPPFERLVLEHTFTPLHQGAFDALVSFSFNIGKDAFLSSDVLSLLNTGETLAAAEAMGAWRKAKIEGRTIIVDALVRRRASEKALFLSDPAGPAPAPSAIIRPRLDPAIQVTSSRDRAVVVESANDSSSTGLPYEPSEDRRSKQPQTTISAPRPMERLTRRFNEVMAEEDSVSPPARPPSNSQTIVDPNAGPTPEEITAAISELVNGAAAVEEQNFNEDLPGIDLDEFEPSNDLSDLQPSNDDDLEPYPDFDFILAEDEAFEPERFERTLGEKVELEELPSAEGPILIDDLEPVEVSEDDIQKAMLLNREMSSPQTGHVRNWGPFAFFAVIGAFLFSWGTWGMQERDSANESALMPLELILIIVGAILFVTMAYYFVRELVKREN